MGRRERSDLDDDLQRIGGLLAQDASRLYSRFWRMACGQITHAEFDEYDFARVLRLLSAAASTNVPAAEHVTPRALATTPEAATATSATQDCGRRPSEPRPVTELSLRVPRHETRTSSPILGSDGADANCGDLAGPSASPEATRLPRERSEAIAPDLAAFGCSWVTIHRDSNGKWLSLVDDEAPEPEVRIGFVLRGRCNPDARACLDAVGIRGSAIAPRDDSEGVSYELELKTEHAGETTIHGVDVARIEMDASVRLDIGTLDCDWWIACPSGRTNQDEWVFQHNEESAEGADTSGWQTRRAGEFCVLDMRLRRNERLASGSAQFKSSILARRCFVKLDIGGAP